MTTIYKFQLYPGYNELSMPKDAQALTVQMQDLDAFLWAKVDPKKPNEKRTFHVYGTGPNMPDDPRMLYVATFQMVEMGLVWHVFDTTHINEATP
jgi:hypothetical protein